MSERYFNDFSPDNVIKADIESDRIFDIRDSKWAHPDLRDKWDMSSAAGTAVLYSPDIPKEEKAVISAKLDEATRSYMADAISVATESNCESEDYTISGCPEEPDAATVIRVTRKKNKKTKKSRVLFYIMGGALVSRDPDIQPFEQYCEKFNCVTVSVLFRRSWEAPYPAAVNDLHAGYKWVVDNAEMLGVDPEKIVLHGHSSGGHLATALAFRLKRYGYRPRGVVAVLPQTDDRFGDGCASHIYNGAWDAVSQKYALAQYMGKNSDSSLIGPEALANHATVKDCIGYPPLFLHAAELDPDRDFNRAFYGKVLEAKSFAEYHCWGGSDHGCIVLGGSPYADRFCALVDANVEDCFQYDLRRPWVEEESKPSQ